MDLNNKKSSEKISVVRWILFIIIVIYLQM